jgi:hypothetical protein
MRFLVRAKIPTEAVNKMVQDPNFLKNPKECMNKVKPEAAYFLPLDGDRRNPFTFTISICKFMSERYS